MATLVAPAAVHRIDRRAPGQIPVATGYLVALSLDRSILSL
ncbi:MAG: hypothetical protein JWN96_559, partial [Mycobacterium sp.]|nr:hypothetical protein [Mycobacterium sp.]